MFIRPTTERDLQVFVPSREDISEAEAAGHPVGFPDVTECVTLYARLNTCEMPLAIGGNMGDQVWFVTSRDVIHLSMERRKEFRVCVLEYRDRMLEKYQALWNYVWTGNRSHVRFLKSIGAEFHEDFADDDKTFQLFTIRR